MIENKELKKSEDFWNANPCDGQSSYIDRYSFRYGKEPWLVPILIKIASKSKNLLEIGCGQGTDGITLIKNMPISANYTGIDLSKESIFQANENAKIELKEEHAKYDFQVGNAEKLCFEESSFDTIYSMGVLHHTPNIENSLKEIKRVLLPKGSAHIILYKTFSPKLLIAHGLRNFQKMVDKISGTNNSLLSVSKKMSFEKYMGTAIEECFGVPILNSYKKSEVYKLFSEFKNVSINPYGLGLPPLGFNKSFDQNPTIIGYYWYVIAEK